MNPKMASDVIVEEITIQASADRVFEALANPVERVRWWHAEGRFQVTQMESDLRPGGRWNMQGTGMGGKPFLVRGEYRAIDRPCVLEFTWLPDWQEDATESVVRIELNETGGVTTVRLTHPGLSQKGRESHRGWPQVLGLLQAYVEGKK